MARFQILSNIRLQQACLLLVIDGEIYFLLAKHIYIYLYTYVYVYLYVYLSLILQQKTVFCLLDFSHTTLHEHF